MKKIAIILGMVALLAVAAVFAASLFVSTVTQKAVPAVASKVLGTSVELTGAKVKLYSGQATLQGLSIANPSGFSKVSAVQVGEVSVSLAPLSVLGGVVHVKRIFVNAPEITLEQSAKGNNLKALLANTQPTQKAAAESAEPATEAAPAGGLKLLIDEVVVQNGKVKVNVPGIAAANVPLPKIHLTNIGKNTGGVTPQELTQEIVRAVMASSVQAGTNVAGGALKSALEASLKGADSGEAAVNALKDGLRGFFGK